MWLQRDAPQMVRDALRRAGLPHETVRAELPDNWSKRKNLVVTVNGGGTPDSRRGVTGENVEVRVRAPDMHSARRMMNQIDAFLQNPAQAGWFWQVTPATGLIVLNDSKIGGALASAVYTVTTSRGAS